MYKHLVEGPCGWKVNGRVLLLSRDTSPPAGNSEDLASLHNGVPSKTYFRNVTIHLSV